MGQKVLQRFFVVVVMAAALLPGAGVAQTSDSTPSPLTDCYEPIPGGWHLRISADPAALRAAPGASIGVVSANAGYSANPRLHRRPLFPPADRKLVFTGNELAKLARNAFRPLVLAYNEPRFLFDFHSAGGLLGHLYLGLTCPDGGGKWFHQWPEVEVSYVDGRMVYVLRDPKFPGVTVSLEASPLADAAGLAVKLDINGQGEGCKLVWAYGGASAYFTNWAMNAKEFDFAPAQCAKNDIGWDRGRFTLTRGFEKSDVVMNEVFAVARKLPEWKAVIRGASSWEGRSGSGDPEAFMQSPADLAASAQWDGARTTGRVAVQEAPLTAKHAEGFVVVGMGRKMDRVLARPGAAWEAALARNEATAGRVVTNTPDPYLDAAMPMMAFATEGAWGDISVLHGGWSWRFAYLGWRGWYGTECYGWSDRIRKSIQNFVKLDRVDRKADEGALGSMMDYDQPGVFYNMNEVFLDQVRQYFDYTNDLALMREIFPALAGILEWENRRLLPDPETPLYENALNTWISDQHWYIRGQCTQASAYMLRAHEFLAGLAGRLGKDPAPWRDRAEAIRRAMQETLWMPREGVFAEYKDTLGAAMLHTEPELPTIYHAAEFGAASPLQISQMLHWADTRLRTETTPGGGRLYWSSNWYPNMARSYTHSTYEMAYAEELNFALTNYQAGRADAAYAIERACLAGIFNGVTPGGLACHSYVDGRQRANDEFTDASSMFGRTVLEGLFGIAPKRPEGRVDLTPQFPTDWTEASIASPQLSYQWLRDGGKVSIEWTAPEKTIVRLRLPLCAASVSGARINGQSAKFSMEPGVGLSWLTLETAKPAKKGLLEVDYTPADHPAPSEIQIVAGGALQLPLPGAHDGAVTDPQGLLVAGVVRNGVLEGTATAAPGPGVLFAAAGADTAPFLIPVRLSIQPQTPPPPRKVWQAPVLPDRDLNRWALVDLGGVYNTSVNDAMKEVWTAMKPPAPPATEINTAYYKDHLVEPFVSPPPSDEAWRGKVGANGVAWTTDGIPFKSARTGPNIAVVTRVALFPRQLEFPVGAAGRTIYLMISGTTFAMQSHVVNLRVTLTYADGTGQPSDLVNPFGIGDCWNQYRYHDTAANGFENLGGRSGPAGSSEAADLTKPVAVDTEAHLLALNLRPGQTLQSVRLEAVANDVIFGVMGASVLK